MKKERKKRITMSISNAVEAIKLKVEADLGTELSYTQTIEVLINFYLQRNNVKTNWVKS
jgi:hypothetical protein